MSLLLDPLPPPDGAAVLARFDAVLAWSRQHASRLGYFAALYRGVTLRARSALAAGAFEQPQAAERLVVLFATRYFEALAAHLGGAPVTRSWQVAFDAAGRWRPTVSQHLLLGINAHINLDLGIAAARTLADYPLPRADFERVNDLLLLMVDEVQDRLAAVWPLLRLADNVAGRLDETLIGAALVQTRAAAWDFGQALHASGGGESGLIERQDRHVAAIGQHIAAPALPLSLALAGVRMGELRVVAGIIDLLDQEVARAGPVVEAKIVGQPGI
ncbi:hypothetical protein Tamer19_04380 [Cupriavidus sp. TA19]|uniref:DUF5995 family protein n=1 Tax=unclassified Cupriavidus TaxID=2640874 RepID=UPI000E2EFCFA|nr:MULTISPECIES: DUF5995 family protein [unclassified Cupriavidus]BDB24234.1 hypothetical protein CTP10_R15820 [Cupriavidus sp. P-10]GLC91030.1 hypothetical protein Tamer19_04380 [Cupriavidus sp. TA19]